MSFSRTLIPFLALSLVACGAPTSLSDDRAKSSTPVIVAPFTGTMTTIDTINSTISFIGKSSIVDHPGSFGLFTATFKTDAKTPADITKASLKVTIDLTSVKTDSQGLDKHLQREDFFHTEKYKEAVFTSKSIQKGAETGAIMITGDLTIKGVTKEVTATGIIDDTHLMASFDIPRKEFDIGNDAYGQKLLNPIVPVNISFMFHDGHQNTTSEKEDQKSVRLDMQDDDSDEDGDGDGQ